MKSFVNKYKHGFFILSYCLIYLVMFHFLETKDVQVYHVIHTAFDDMIPFCEYFVVPYLLWFPYMIGAILFFVFFNRNKREYYQLSLNLMMGMTIFLVVSYFYPNIQHLRPESFARDNIFTHMVAYLYSIDTPTNILPSIHVFNSLAIHMAISHSEMLKEKKVIRRASLILTILIIMSTMALKQHSVIDVCLGASLAFFGNMVFYPAQETVNALTEAAHSSFAGKRRGRSRSRRVSNS